MLEDDVKTKWICFLFLIFSMLAWAMAGTTFAEPVKKVAVVPFTVYAEKDLTFLQKGLVDMLTSRLSQEGEVTVLGRDRIDGALKQVEGPLNPDSAAQFGRQLDADYVLYGSLTVFGESVSVDAKMIDVSGERPPLSFFTQSGSFGEVIPAVDRFAAEINETVFGRVVAEKAPPTPSAETPGTRQPEIYTHPEKLIEGGFGDESWQKGLPGKGIALARPWKSRTFTDVITAMDLGDVDGDGRIETVLALPKKVLVYRWDAGRFYQTAEFEVSGFRSTVGVDIADINGNGIAEIFVSALNGQANGVDSMVYEFVDGQYVPIVEGAPYLFRVVEGSVFGRQLFGQRHRIGSSPFSTPIFELNWEGDNYGEGNQVLSAGKANVLGFSAGSPIQPQERLYVAYSKGDYLQVLDPSGSAVWESADKLGGSTLHVQMAIEDPGVGENRAYLPMRIRLRDFDGDEVDEVVVAANKEMASRRLKQFRNFTETQLVIFGWDGIGLAPIWKTRGLSGHIRDLAVGDFDGDGIAELVGVLIQAEGRVVGVKPKCAVIAYEIAQRKPAEGEPTGQ
jgi:TolB-like protein